jgi:hypothetical protein
MECPAGKVNEDAAFHGFRDDLGGSDAEVQTGFERFCRVEIVVICYSFPAYARPLANRGERIASCDSIRELVLQEQSGQSRGREEDNERQQDTGKDPQDPATNKRLFTAHPFY